MIALVEDDFAEEVVEGLMEAGAQQVIVTMVAARS